ncbi:hypothetical protein J45TS6_47220 [Paenibacillus sp. J45TS6]|nr:hypothetical protein J45TS6_47220 [Paenibacillus sp. J45TS6]
MIQASQCKIRDTYKDVITGQVFVVKEYGHTPIFEYLGHLGNYTTTLKISK